MSKAETGKRLGTQLAGVAFLMVLVLMLWLTVAIYERRFESVETVTLRADRIGNQMEINSEVKSRGVPFGYVSDVRATDRGAEIELAMDPATIDQLPRNVSARLLPKTVFGQRYVNLVLPEDPAARSLSGGDVIPQDRSKNAIELERVLGNLLPLLRAVQPEKLSASLGAVSQALDQRGEPLGDSIVKLNKLLSELNPLMPQFKKDVSGVADVAELYDEAAPDILRALTDLTVTGRTITEHRSDLQALYTDLTASSDELTAFLRKNKDSLIGFTEASRPTFELLARYASSFPCLFDAVNRFKPLMEKALGAGTGEPGLHVDITVQQPRGKYVPGRDDPVHDAGGGPRCYPPGAGPGQGVRPAGGARGAVSTAQDSAAAGPLALEQAGIANSPYERQLIAELMAPALGTTPDAVPGWSSLLVGPLLRGTEVTLK
ncbi:MCE family protein [Amycolatopsis cihanbeyliensis]|uniref:Virulence factor Mce-like protein n=1 Tax=Amycolatopsis cihanbeyliensis TaxID=1128664 RepID=A0A542DR89_AMYCI|nr:MCE family protein [Amycolatopsis cihanbeyliensis]TQJ05546.1 virulence factor Mce-like protein [Amycolatopsis cihanbeyliensis]